MTVVLNDLAGVTVGMLRVERLDGMSDRLGSIWVCTCLGCGRELRRLGAKLRQARSDAARSGCYECRRATATARRRVAKAEWFRTLFRQTGSLYTAQSERRHAQQVAHALEAAGHRGPVVALPVVVVDAEDGGDGNPAPGGHGGMSTEEIAAELGVCRARVQQIEQKAMSKLRKLMKRLRTADERWFSSAPGAR